MSMPGAWPVEEEESCMEMTVVKGGTGANLERKTSVLRPDPDGAFIFNMASKSTPTGRPLTEPPMFNYDDFVRRFVPSDKRFRLLFPERKDVGKMTDYMDRHIEYELLETYVHWLNEWCGTYSEQAMVKNPDRWNNHLAVAKKEQHKFYRNLRGDLYLDMVTVYKERNHCHIDSSRPGTLAYWEFQHLDDDLDTKQIERDLARFRDEIFEESFAPKEAREKYEHLFPADADDDFKLWHQRTKHALEKERKEKELLGQKMTIEHSWLHWKPDTVEGLEYTVREELKSMESETGEPQMIVTRRYKDGQVEYVSPEDTTSAAL